MILSVITINRNNAEGLRKTMESVSAQIYQDFEYIIVDGASTDSSVDVIREMSATLNDGMSCDKSRNDALSFKWISELIYNAMNKGVKMCSGEYILMLNSGDYLIDEHVIERIIPELDGTDIIQGNIIKISNGREIVCVGVGKSDITFLDAMHAHFLHQASFCRRELFDKYGYFDESYRINGDTVFYAKCLAFGNATFRYVNLNIAYFDTTGISADPEGKWRKLRYEEDKRYMDMFSSRMQSLLKEEKKIKLYDKLHAHHWSWNMTMAVAHLVNLFHRSK